MSADSNMGFHQGIMPSSSLQNRHMLSFQSGSMSSSAGLAGSVNVGNFSGQIGGSLGNCVYFSGGPSVMNSSMAAAAQAGPSSSNSNFNPVAMLKQQQQQQQLQQHQQQQLQQDSGLSPEWTPEEQYKLKQGLVQYATENSIMKYIKIASMLPRKTVRDVAMRCRWLAKQENSRRRKLEEYYAGKRMNNRKMVDSCSKPNMQMINPSNITSFAPVMHQANQNNLFSTEAPALDAATQQLMDDNVQILHQISANLATFKIQENIDLFCQTSNNIRTILNKYDFVQLFPYDLLNSLQKLILNNMSNMPGIMSQMPPLPEMPNDELLCTILPSLNQAFMFGGPDLHLDQQPPPQRGDLL